MTECKSFKTSRVNVTDNAFHIKLANVGRAERHEESVKSEFLIRFSATTEKLRFNPLSAKPTKWSNTLKQFAGKSGRFV